MRGRTPTHGTAKTDRRSLAHLAERLGPDELAVLVLIAERLLLGRRHYGELSLAGDRRNFQREALEKAADLAVYAAAGLLRGKRALREKRGKLGKE